MTMHYIPEGYHSVTPYMVVEDVDRLVDFLTAAFGAEEKERVPNQDGKTGHAEVLIGDSYVMMGRAQEDFPALPCMLYVYVPDTDASYAQALKVHAGAAGHVLRRPQCYGEGSHGQRLDHRNAPRNPEPRGIGRACQGKHALTRKSRKLRNSGRAPTAAFSSPSSSGSV